MLYGLIDGVYIVSKTIVRQQHCRPRDVARSLAFEYFDAVFVWEVRGEREFIKTASHGSLTKILTCPLLLRVFCNTGRHHNIMDYNRGNVPANELQIYTWCVREVLMDATLREITSLVKEVNPDSRRKGTYFDFSLVSPDVRSPSYRMREIGYNILNSSPHIQNLLNSAPRIIYTSLISETFWFTLNCPTQPQTSGQRFLPMQQTKMQYLQKIHQYSASFISRITQIEYPMKGQYDCSIENIVYQLQCNYCIAEYISLTTGTLGH
ncbi:unnamed protein product [Timema podura]|uniref:18 kDa Sin3-associated polypeptide n=1 Tax=Timema podura TaxID=61482 RepID=A0ABN7NXX3_TIMPD|nr:unnamed protein product [Timema podura]